MPVDAVVAGIDLPTDKPLRERSVELANSMPSLEPVELFRPTLPKSERFFCRPPIDARIADIRPRREFIGGREGSGFIEKGIDRFRHGRSSGSNGFYLESGSLS